MTSVLALDLGTTTGFAWRGASGSVVSGTWKLKPSRYEGGGMRFLRFTRQLEAFDNSVALTAVYFEEVRRHVGTDAAHVYGGLLGCLTGWCEAKNIPYQGVGVGQIKKFWCGNGHAKKDAMIERARLLGFDPVDDNEADALALLHMKMGES
jgi:Holliday junction resolvasome RuvABC endonuclease subunit